MMKTPWIDPVFSVKSHETQGAAGASTTNSGYERCRGIQVDGRGWGPAKERVEICQMTVE